MRSAVLLFQVILVGTSLNNRRGPEQAVRRCAPVPGDTSLVAVPFANCRASWSHEQQVRATRDGRRVRARARARARAAQSDSIVLFAYREARPDVFSLQRPDEVSGVTSALSLPLNRSDYKIRLMHYQSDYKIRLMH